MLEFWYFTWVFLVTTPFYGYQHFWSCGLDHFLKTFTLTVTSQQWVLEVWYFTIILHYFTHYMFLVTLLFRGYQHILPTTLIFEFGLLWKFNHFNNISTASARVFLFHINIPFDKLFLLVLNFLTLTFDLFFKMLTVVITS